MDFKSCLDKAFNYYRYRLKNHLSVSSATLATKTPFGGNIKIITNNDDYVKTSESTFSAKFLFSFLMKSNLTFFNARGF